MSMEDIFSAENAKKQFSEIKSLLKNSTEIIPSDRLKESIGLLKKRKALILGITGMDGSYLSELLLEKDYEVHGIIRRSSSFNSGRIDHIFDKLHLHYGDITDSSGIAKILDQVQPDEIYNLAAQSHVRVSFDCPEYTVDVTAGGTIRLLESIRQHCPGARYYQASSSEMYGKVQETPQTETTRFYPRSPYACAKVFSYYQTINYREAYGLHASNGILFNHTSPRRGETFVCRKITKAAAMIAAKKQKELVLGNIEAKRDWGHSWDYVRAMWMMLQQPHPDDYVIATGVAHSVRDLLDEAFGHFGLDWSGFVKFDERYLRPTEVDLLIGDTTRAKIFLGWEPTYTFQEIIKEMCTYDWLDIISDKKP